MFHVLTCRAAPSWVRWGLVWEAGGGGGARGGRKYDYQDLRFTCLLLELGLHTGLGVEGLGGAGGEGCWGGGGRKEVIIKSRVSRAYLYSWAFTRGVRK